MLVRIFCQRRNGGGTDLEAIESALRFALHQAGASALTELLQFEAPMPDQRHLPCACGHRAHYQELRSRPVLTVVGWVRMNRPWYLCERCHQGQFPTDEQLDVKDTDFSPGVRRMQAIVGLDAPFDHGREQIRVLAGLEVTAKSVERTAEAIGSDIAAREQREIRKAVQLDLPVVIGKPIPILYVQMDGPARPHTRSQAGVRIHSDHA